MTALTEPGTPAADLLIEDDAVFQVPSIFDAEVLSALRGLVRGLKFDQAAATDLIVDLMVLPVDRWHMSPLLPRMWELRDHLTPCDAAYVALAELTGAVLVTGDERITTAPGTRCDIQIIKQTARSTLAFCAIGSRPVGSGRIRERRSWTFKREPGES